MVDIQSVAAEIRRGKKKKKKVEITGQKYNLDLDLSDNWQTSHREYHANIICPIP